MNEDLRFYKDILRLYDYNEVELINIIQQRYNMKPKGKCLLFSRVSTVGQDVDQQADSVREEAFRMGYDSDHQVELKYKESAIKLSIDDRKSIIKLKEVIENDTEIKCVICWELSRIARRADVMYDVRDFLIAHKIQWIIMNPYMCLLDENGNMTPTASLMLAVFTSLVETEMTIKQERMYRGKMNNKKLGKNTGGKPPFGYTTDDKKYFIINEDEARIVRLLYERYATGRYSYKTLAEEAQEYGYLKNYKSLYAFSGIACIISDERYTGSNKIYPQIISQELYNICKEVRKNQNHILKPTTMNKYLCRRLLYDKETGLTYTPSTHRYSNTAIHVVISRKAIDNMIWDIAKELYKNNVSNLDLEIQKLKQNIKNATQKYNYSIERRKKILDKIDRLEERMIEGKISAAKSESLSQQYNDDLVKAETNIKDFLGETVYNKIQLKKLNNTHKMPNLDSLELSEKIDIVHLTMSRVNLERIDNKTVKAEILTNFGFTLMYELYNYTGKFKLIGRIAID